MSLHEGVCSGARREAKQRTSNDKTRIRRDGSGQLMTEYQALDRTLTNVNLILSRSHGHRLALTAVQRSNVQTAGLPAHSRTRP